VSAAGSGAPPTGTRAAARRRALDILYEADLLGRPGAPLPLDGGALRLELGAWEIRTLLLRLPTPR